jgi:hypothetical protein
VATRADCDEPSVALAGELAQLLGWIAGDEQRLGWHTGGPRLRGCVIEDAFGVASLGAQQVREQRRGRVDEPVVALQGPPHGGDQDCIARRPGELERLVERSGAGFRSVRSDEDEPHRRMLVMRHACRIGADAGGFCGFSAAAVPSRGPRPLGARAAAPSLGRT